MDRQPLTDRLGDKLLAEYGGAAAAYSLRALNGNGDKVVRVRRASDNAEKDFTASQLSTGEMTNWVNSQIVPPLDIGVETSDGRPSVPDGGTSIGTPAAAYSLRSLGEGQADDIVPSGDTVTPAAGAYVVQVRRSSDNNVKSFTASEVADGTLEDWVNTAKDYVGYAYFTGSSTANVNLSSGFTLEASKSWSIKFEYIGGDLTTGLFGKSAFANGGFWFANSHTIGLTDNSDSYQALSFGTELALNIGQNHEVEFFNTPSEGVRVAIDGTTMSTTPKIYGDITINRIGVSRGRDGNRVIHNVRVDLNGDGTLDYSYAGDGNQASNWDDRVGSNDGTPTAQVSTYNNEFTNGYVRTWYDQSTSDNHATQTTNASQPKIVDAGTLVAGGIDFDGAGQKLETPTTSVLNIDGAKDKSIFAKGTVTASENFVFLGNSSSTDGKSIRYRSLSGNARFEVQGGGVTGGSLLGAYGAVYSSIFSGTQLADADVSSNGSITDATGTLAINTANTVLGIGYTSGGTAEGAGQLSELIIYDSDQSANRTALEANIGEFYGISGIPAYDNTVDGFVETWYDQSGNGNDATQTVASNQPKIVDAGTYLGEIDFDGNDFLPLSGDGLNLFRNVGYGHLFSVVTPDVTGTGTGRYFVGSDWTGSYWTRKFLLGDSTASAARTRLGARRLDADSFDNFTSNVSHNNTETLMTGFVNWADASAYLYFNGTEVGSDTNFLTAGNTEDTARTTIAIGGETDVLSSDFKAKEFIIYNTDQSANRTAIEANINNHYSIY